jgi:hypothetical protein
MASREAGFLVRAMMILLACVLPATIALSASIYVSTAGNDVSGSGTYGNPYRTVQKGVDMANEGDTVNVLSGSYGEYVAVSKAVFIFGTDSPTLSGFTFKTAPVIARGFKVLSVGVEWPARIQDAVNAISSGGTVDLGPGTYTENVVIDRIMNLIGSTPTKPTIDGGGTGNCITLASPYVRCKQMYLTNGVNAIGGTTTNSQLRFLIMYGNSGSGISLTNSDYNLLHANTIYNHTNGASAGIELIGCRGNTIAGNEIYSNTYNISISGSMYRSSSENLVEGNRLLDPGMWSVEVSSGAAETQVNYNVFNTATTGNKFVNNSSTAGQTLDAQRNWFGGQNSPGGAANPGDFSGSVDSSEWLSSSTPASMMVGPRLHSMSIDEAIYAPVLCYVPPGQYVRRVQATFSWNPDVAKIEDDVYYPGYFFGRQLSPGQTETRSFAPVEPTNYLNISDEVIGGSTGAGPSDEVPYVGTIFLMRYKTVAAGYDSLKLSGVHIQDNNLADITPMETFTPGVLAVDIASLPKLIADVKVFMEGPFNGSTMDMNLGHNSLLPMAQPYNTAPWNYSGSETVGAIPEGAVDWVLVELRTDTTASSAFATRAGWLMNTGVIEELLGGRPLIFPVGDPGNYYIVVRHRNHLAIMSSTPVALDENSARYDFTTGVSKYYGGDAKNLASGIYGMYGGDADGSGDVAAEDRTVTWNERNLVGYLQADVDLSSDVGATDRALTWNNRNKSSRVP